MQKNTQKILKEAISPFDYYCDGFGSPGASGKGYINGVVLGTGKVPITLSHSGSEILDSILAFDKAEVGSAYIGQINMIGVSSFCGLSGLLWGYDLVKGPGLQTPHPLCNKKIQNKNFIVNVYSASSLINACALLFGTVKQKRFPLLPGAHVPCAGRYLTFTGPKNIYAAIGIGIAQNRRLAANVFMEDLGDLPVNLSDEEAKKEKIRILTNVAKSIISIGENQEVRYSEIYLEISSLQIKENEIGCAMVAVPYFTLAKKALTENLTETCITEWEAKVSRNFLYKNQEK